jgi:hypothetical protein
MSRREIKSECDQSADAARKRNEQYEADALKLIQTLSVNEQP